MRHHLNDKDRSDAAPGWRAFFAGLQDAAWKLDPASARLVDGGGEPVASAAADSASVLPRRGCDAGLPATDATTWARLAGGMAPGDTLVYSADLRCRSGAVVQAEIALSCQRLDGRLLYVALTRAQALEAP